MIIEKYRHPVLFTASTAIRAFWFAAASSPDARAKLAVAVSALGVGLLAPALVALDDLAGSRSAAVSQIGVPPRESAFPVAGVFPDAGTFSSPNDFVFFRTA
jgi:hypothetical protein